jgi:N-carbamoyl-L-amino-acid hydrolase
VTAGLSSAASASFDALMAELAPLGRTAAGGYARFAWTPVDAELREWFTASAAARGMAVVADRAGNLWAWSGNPDADGPGVVLGSHLDSVPDGGAYDGPLGIVSAFAAIDELRSRATPPQRPVAVACFADEEGARFGVACAGSRLLTGALAAEPALRAVDMDGTTRADALRSAGVDPEGVGPDPAALARIGTFVELHIEQGRGLVHTGRPVAVADGIWAHGRWRLDLPGEANHAGTTAMADRRDAVLAAAQVVLRARTAAERHSALATCGRVVVRPNGVNAVASSVTAWLDARGADESRVRDVVAEVAAEVGAHGGTLAEESWTPTTVFDRGLAGRLCALLGDAPLLATGAGHDAGILAAAGVPTAMLFVRNPTGVSHSPAEHADRDDCLAGVAALASVLADLAA